MEHYVNGYITNGSYFVYKGVRYGRYTQILFTEDFYKRVGEYRDPFTTHNWKFSCGYKFPYFKTFHSIENRDGKMIWKLQNPKFTMFKPDEYINVIPERDIENIIIPVWYMTPRELVKKRFHDGSWISYIWKQTLFYICCLIISPLFKEWYVIWTTGMFIYLHSCYKELSKGELYRGW